MKTLLRHVAFWTILPVCLAAAGCGGPEVTFEHMLPADFPANEAGPKISPDNIQAGEFTVVAGPKEDYAARMAEIVADRLKKKQSSAESSAKPTVRVDGEIFIESSDQKGRRTLRRLRPDMKEVEFIDVDTLVRTADVRVVFSLINISDGAALGGVEVRKNYSSLADPRVRGEWGLSRADDPVGIPETKTIIDELMCKCADSLVEMLTPHAVSVTVTLKATATPLGRQGQDAARRKAYGEALSLFKAAIQADPNDTGSVFNLAVMEEMAGQLPSALEHYTKFASQASSQDEQAAEAVTRVKRLMMRIK